jgi:DNA repair protein RAD50
MQSKAKLDGQLEMLRASAAETRREMTASHDLRNCEKLFREAVVESTLLENIVADLDQYHKALDNALMRFHKLKVAEINAIIRELWSSTYQGADIDCIEIRSDFEEKEDGAAGPAGGGKGCVRRERAREGARASGG